MKFKKEFMQKVAYDEAEGVKIIENNIVDNSRWSVIHKIVFSFNGKFYESSYSIGATEQQDESPYEYDNEEIECSEVKPVNKTTIVYEKIK